MTTDADVRAIDCWVNPMTPGQAASSAPEFLKTVAREYFKREEEVFRGTPLDQMVARWRRRASSGRSSPAT